MNADIVKKYESSPEFRSLPFSDQLELRAKLFRLYVDGDEKFNSLTSEEQASFYKKFLYRTPKYQDREYENTVRQQANRFKTEGKLPTKDLLGISGVGGMSLTGGLVKNYALPFFEKIGDTQTSAYTKKMLDRTTGDDGRKTAEYFSHLSSKDKRSKSAYRQIMSMGAGGGFLAEMIPMLWTGNQAHKITAAATKGIAGAAKHRLTTKIVSRTIPMLAEETVEGFLFMLKEKERRVQSGEWDPAMETFGEYAKMFGQGAAIDFGFGLVRTIGLPFAGAAGRVLWRGIRGKSMGEFASAADYSASLTKFMNNEMPEADFNRLSPSTQEKWYHGRELWRAGKQADADPERFALNTQAHTHIAANEISHSYYVTPDGMHRLRNVDDVNDVHDFATLTEANRFIADTQKDILKRIPVDEQEKYFRGSAGYEGYRRTPELIDGEYDILDTKVRNNIDLTPEESSALASRAESYIPETRRGAITAGEAGEHIAAAQARGHRAIRVDLPVDESVATRLSKNGTYFDDTRVQNVVPSENGNALLYARDLADFNTYRKAALEAEEIRNAGSKIPIDDLMDDVLIKWGYDAAQTMPGDTGAISSLFPSKIKIIDDAVNPSTGRFGRGKYVKNMDVSSSDVSSKAFIDSELRAQVGPTVMKNDAMLVEGAASIVGKVEPDQVREVSKLYTDRLGGRVNDIEVKLTDNTEGFVFAQAEGSKIKLQVPRDIKTPASQRNFVRTLFEQLNDVTKKSGTVGDWKRVTKGKDFEKLFRKSRAILRPNLKTAKELETWFDSLLKSDLGGGSLRRTSQGIELDLPSGKRTHATIDEAIDDILVDHLTLGELKADLGRKGYHVVKKNGQLVVRGKNGKEVASGRTVRELFENMNYRPEKISSRFGPRVAVITDGHGEVVIDGKLVSGSRSKVSQFLDSFESEKEIEAAINVFSNDDGLILRNITEQFEVRIPKYGIIKKFDNVKEARRFMSDGYKEVDTISDLAKRKGLTMDYRNGNYTFTDGVSGEVRTAHSLDEVDTIFRSTPDPSGAPELLDADILADVEDVIKKNPMPAEFESVHSPLYPNPHRLVGENTVADWQDAISYQDPHNRIGFMRNAARFIEPFDDWLRKATNQSGHQELYRLYSDLASQTRAVKPVISESARVAHVAFDPVVKAAKNKKVLRKKLKGITRVMEHDVNSDAAKKIISDFDLTDVELGAASKLHELYDALFLKSDVNPHKFIQQYAPHIREWVLTHTKQEVGDILSAKDLYSKIFHNAPPKEIRFWAENDRVTDLIDMCMIDDPVELFSRYNAKMHKKMYLNESWQNLYEYMSTSKKAVPREIVDSVNEYREMVMGIHRTKGEQRMIDAMFRFHQSALGGRKNNIEAWNASRDALSGMFAVNYLTNMGFRGYLPIRNMTQVYTMLGSRFTNDLVSDAIIDVRKGGDGIFARYKQSGLIPDQPPIAGADQYTGNSWLQSLTKRSLQGFKNSDEWTRAVAARVTELQFDEALDKFRRKVFKDYDEFEKYAQINLIEMGDRSRIKKLVESGQEETARLLYADRVIRDTMFDYSTANTPAAARGITGKMAFQYGTYSVNYTQNVLKGLRNGTKAQRVGFMTRFLANSAMLYAAFSAAGIQANNFLPWQPALFSGGPYFDLAYDAVKSVGTGYRGRESRAKVGAAVSPVNFKQLWQGEGLHLRYPSFVPGYTQYRNIRDARDYASQGNLWLSYLAVTSAPVREDLRI